MNKKSNHRNRFIHLYDPKKEGLGTYDIHYINAYKKNKHSKAKLNEDKRERYAA